MKTAIAVLCIIGYALTAQGQPPKASYCQGNNDDLTTCSACLNTGTQARQFATNACTTLIANTVTDCKWYNPVITATKSLSDCFKCDSKDWLNKTDHASAASLVIACSDTAIGTTDCAAKVDNVTNPSATRTLLVHTVSFVDCVVLDTSHPVPQLVK